ncbi:tail protein with lysin activity [Bacillus phage G]|uniref:Gp183 n=1 Tax=Bacillus phage G TaxID=2884420 RepID=G3MBP9_9CAUD|nr:tail protein with lysin activity [Bacillus phage G]AEO93443.1 gp183 [Bacillus phage G]
MSENKVIKAIMGQINDSFEKVENYKINGNADGAIQELDKLMDKLGDVEQQFKTAGGDAFTKNIQESFANAKAQVQDYMNFLNSSKDQLEFGEISRNAAQNFDNLKNKFNELNQSLNGIVSNPALDDFTKKLESIKDVNLDISEKVRQFDSQLGEMGKSVEKLKQNIESQLQLIDFGSIGGNEALSSFDKVLSSILERVNATKDQVNSEVSKMLSPEHISSDGATEKINSFVNDVKRMGEEIIQTSNEIKASFGSLFSNLSNDVDDNTISMLERLSDVIGSLKDNNIEIKNPLSDLITSLKSINEKDIDMVANLSNALNDMLNMKFDQGNNTVFGIMELNNGLNSMKSTIEDAANVFKSLFDVVNNDNSFNNFANQMKDMQAKMNEMNSAMNEISSSSMATINSLQTQTSHLFNPRYSEPLSGAYGDNNINPRNPRPDQFYGSAGSMGQDFYQDRSYQNMMNQMHSTQNNLGRMLWNNYDEERYGHGGDAPWITRSGNRTKEALIENNEISALINLLSSDKGLKRSIRDLPNNVNAYGSGGADDQFATIEKRVEKYVQNIEQLLSKFSNMKNIDADGSFDDILLEMINNGKNFVNKFDDVLSELPSEMRRKLKGNSTIDEYRKMADQYNAEALDRTVNSDLRGKYASENAYTGDGTDFFLQMLSGSKMKGGAASLSSAMQGLSSNYDYDPSLRSKMLSASSYNDNMLSRHDKLLSSLDGGDHNLIMKNATEFMESGKLSLGQNTGIMSSLAASLSTSGGKDSEKTLSFLKDMDSQARETGSAIKDIMENLIQMMELKAVTLEGDERSKFEEQLDKIKEKLKGVNEEMARSSEIRTDAFVSAASSFGEDDYDRADDESISYLSKRHSQGYSRIQRNTSNLRSHAYAAKMANMSGNPLRGYRRGDLSNNRLDNISDISRDLEARMYKINGLRSEFDEAAADPTRKDEARDKLYQLNDNQSQMNNLAKQLAKQTQMSDKDLKDAPPEVKNVYNAVQEMLDSTKTSNVEMMQLNELLGLDELNEDLIKTNQELDKVRNSNWDKFKSGIKDVGDTIKNSIISPLQSVGGTASNLAKSGLGAMGLGSLSSLAVNPFSLSSIMGGVFSLAGDMFQSDIAQGQAKNTLRSSEMMVYGANSGSNVNDMMSRGLQYQDDSYGLINYSDLTRTYSGLASNVVGQYGQASSLAQKDMNDFADTSLALQKGYGIGEGTVNDAINTFYKELRMNVNETEYELAKIGQTAQSLNVPFGKHLENVTSMAKQYKSMGFEAEYASEVVGNLMFQHGMTYDDASSIAMKSANAVTGMSDGWTAFTGMMNGYSGNPLEAVVGLQYGYNQDGTIKDGVIDQRIENLQTKYNMMSMLGGSAGDYAVAKTLSNDGFSNREAGMILDAMKNGDTDFMRDMFTKNMEGTLEDGEKLDPNNPDEYFKQVFDKINQSAEEQLSVTEKILATYRQGIDEIVFANQDLFDSLTPLIGVVDDLMSKLGDFVGGLDDFISSMKDMYQNSFLSDWGMSDFLTAGLVGGGLYGAAKVGSKALARRAFSGGGSRGGNSRNRGGDDDDSDRRRGTGSGSRSIDVDTDTHGSSKWSKFKKAGKAGGKAGLLLGGGALLAEMLLGGGEEASAAENDWGAMLGGSGYNPGGDSVETPESVSVLKDIYNLLAGNGVSLNLSGATGSSSSTAAEEAAAIATATSGGAGMLQNALLIGGAGVVGGGAMSLYRDRNSKGGTTTFLNNSQSARQAAIDAEDEARRARVQQSYEMNRASGQTASEAKLNADREESLRSRSAFNRMSQADYEDLFKTSNTKGIKGALKGLKGVKAAPVIGSALSLGLSAWQVNDEFNDINALAHMTGAKTGTAKAGSVGDASLSATLMGLGAVGGSFIPGLGNIAGAIVGGGLGLGLDWLGDKTGAKDWVLDKLGMGSEDVKDSLATSGQQAAAKSYQKRMGQYGYGSINDDFALIASSSQQKHGKYLSGLSQEEKDAWSSKFTEEYLSKIADGVDPSKAEALAKDQADKLVEIQLGTEDVKELNKEQLGQMLELYSLTGENKEALLEYSDTYFKREEDSRKVLDATSEATGLSLEQLIQIGESMNLLPSELAALIAINSGGSDNVKSAFTSNAKIEDMRKDLEKNKGLSKGTIEDTIAHMVSSAGDLTAKGVSQKEMSRYATYYAGSYQSGKSEEEAAAMAEKQLYADRQADEVLNGKGLMSKVSKYAKDLGFTGARAVGSSITNAQVKDAISTTAAASGMTEWQIKQSLQRQGINEKMFTSYLLQNADRDDAGIKGKLGKSEVSKFLGNKSNADAIGSTMAKSLGYSEQQLAKMEKSYQQADVHKEENQKFLNEKILYTEEYQGSNHNDAKTQRKDLQDLNQKFETTLQKSDQEFRDKLQDAKKKADSENTTSVVDAIGSLGTLLGTRLSELGTALSSMSGMGGSGGIYSGGGGDPTALKKADIKSKSSLSAKELDAWIASKAPKNSLMLGMGKAFKEAEEKSGLNAEYLIAHAAHETGWGTSRIARDKGNFFGIGAFDATPYTSAYGMGGTGSNKYYGGIVEGAMWIAENYANKGQNTLDSMRNNGGKHEYATDPLWDEKIAGIWAGAPSAPGGSGSYSGNVASYYLGNQFTKTSGYKEAGRKDHIGLDLAAPAGTDIYALAAGTVKSTGSHSSAGNYVTIEHDDGSLTKYYHMLTKALVKEGEKVAAGQHIGDVGSTGKSTGNHLHLEYWKNGQHYNPNDILKKVAGIGGFSGDPNETGGTGALQKAITANTEAVGKTTDALKSNTQAISRPILTNASAYDPFSGIHPTNSLDYNRYTFDLYKKVGMDNISENESGVNYQELSKKARNAFDINVKTAIDPSSHPNFTQLLDKHLKVAVKAAVSEATESLDSNYASQFSEIWNTVSSTIDNSKTIK